MDWIPEGCDFEFTILGNEKSREYEKNIEDKCIIESEQQISPGM